MFHVHKVESSEVKTLLIQHTGEEVHGQEVLCIVPFYI